MLGGVGNRIAHNLIHDAPHMAIAFGGNDHVIEFNEIHSVVYESNDAGVMYAGYNPTMRGHEIRYNYIHHIYGFQSKGCVGVYLDDMFCSAHIFGNVFYDVPRAAFIGGGRDNLVENNIFVDCKPAVHVDARCLGWAKDGIVQLRQRLAEMPYRQEPWRSRFPRLLDYLDDEPAVPKGNVIQRNICVGKWDEIEKKARPYVTFRDNLLDADPHFVDATRHNYQLRRRFACLEDRLPADSGGEDRLVRKSRPGFLAGSARGAAAARTCPGSPAVIGPAGVRLRLY